jgi:hypothetical protein
LLLALLDYQPQPTVVIVASGQYLHRVWSIPFILHLYSQQPRSSNQIQMRLAGEINAADNMPRAQLSVDEVANALSFLTLGEIMPLRRVNMTWKDAAKKTIAPATDFLVNNERRYNAMNVMARVLPNLQQIELCALGEGHKYNDGEDPDEEEAARTANMPTHDIEILANFSKIRVLKIWEAFLNGRYPVFFNFPLLQRLIIAGCNNLKWDLEMLAGLPMLKELDCVNNRCMTGNISSLGALKGTLETVFISNCPNVDGNFMDLADFPHLTCLVLECTAVTGDIRDIGDKDFSSLEYLRLPKGVYGGNGYELQRISDAPDLIRTLYLLNKQRPGLKMSSLSFLWSLNDWSGKLSENSPDWYESFNSGFPTPFCIRFVKAGSRIGYRWGSTYDPCEVNWLDPEPDRESDGYDKYKEELEEIECDLLIYRGFHQPPTEEEYHTLLGLS